jgi:hypothetical protein
MHRLFWLMAGMCLGAYLYWYFREQGGTMPGFEELGEQGKRLTERGREFAESGKVFMQSGRQLADESREFAQVAANTAQTRSREVVESVKSQMNRLQGNNGPSAVSETPARHQRENVTAEPEGA